MEQLQTFRSETAFHFIALVIGVEYVQSCPSLIHSDISGRYSIPPDMSGSTTRWNRHGLLLRATSMIRLLKSQFRQLSPKYFIQILNVVCIVLSVTCNDYIKVFLNHFPVMMECAQTQRLSIV